MRTIELYRKHKAGEVSREKFLYEVRRDKNLPWVTNVTSFDDAVRILKNKGIISEANSIQELKPSTKQSAYDAAKFQAQNAYQKDKDGKLIPDPLLKQKRQRQQSVFSRHIDPEVVKKVEAIMRGTGDREVEIRLNKHTDENNNPVVILLVKDNKRGVDATFEIGRSDYKVKSGDISGELNAPVMKAIEYIQNNELKDPVKKDGALNEVDNNIPTDPAVDKVNPYFLKKGVEMLLAKEKELTNDSYIKALNKAASMLEKNPHAFDEEMFANAKDVEKADAKLETEEVKKANHKNKANEMKKIKVKSLKESAIKELAAHLKKKDLVNEDAHYNYNIGSEVHTPHGKGKVTEIVGGTLTVEMEDGKLIDVQINTADHYTKKAQENQADAEKAERDAAWKKFDSLRGASPETGDQMGPSIGQELNYKPEDIHTLLRKYIDKNKDDKEKMAKLKEALKKLKENISDEEITNAQKTGEIVNVPSSNQQDIEKLKSKKVAYSTYKG